MKLNIVPASTGLTWVKLGINTFLKQPLALGGLFFMSIALTQILAIVPIVGAVMAMAIFPAITLGMMVATLESVQGKFPMPVVLTSAFRSGQERARDMLKLGAMYALGLLIVIAAVALIDGGDLPRALAKGPAASSAIAELPNFIPTVLVGLISYNFLSILFWHAPALVYWHNVKPTKAIFFSFIACIRNWAAYGVFAITWFGLFFAGVALISSLVALLGVGPRASLVLLPLALIMTSMFICSIYFTFRDSFVHDEVTASNSEPAA